MEAVRDGCETVNNGQPFDIDYVDEKKSYVPSFGADRP